MIIKFYKNLSDNIVVDKNITQIGSDQTGTLREACSIIDPVIKFEKFTDFDLSACNYLYIPDFGRYYYINEIIAISDKMFEIHCHVDVLRTYRSGIRSNSAVIARQESQYNLYLPDGVFKTYANPHYEIRKFPSGFSGYHYILTVAG